MLRRTLLIVVLLVAGCSARSTGVDDTVLNSAASTPEPPPPPTSEPVPTSPPEPTPAPTVVPTAAPTVAPTAAPEPDCWVIDDFEGAQGGGWQVVLDGVMGGLSSGEAAIIDGRLVLTGTINTNGGGFFMVRRPIDPAVLDGATELRFTAETDGRGYEVIAIDALEGRDRRISHFATIDFAGSVLLEDLEPRSFGNPVIADAFRPDLAFSLGIILSDGIDGDFGLAVDRIEACA